MKKQETSIDFQETNLNELKHALLRIHVLNLQ